LLFVTERLQALLDINVIAKILTATEVTTMAMSDKLLGFMMLLAAGFIFVYYTTWVLVLVSKQVLHPG
jgi:Dolichol phosphate-mannose biosynthesis regulatory protein (DPM2)